MWDAFLNRATQSCLGIGSSSTFAKRKLDIDINSVEYQSYMHKNVISYLDKYPMSTTRPKVKKGSPNIKQKLPNINRSSKDSNDDNKPKKYKPIYLKLDISPKDDGQTQQSRNTPKSTRSDRTRKITPRTTNTDGCECTVSPRRKNENLAPRLQAPKSAPLYEPVSAKCTSKYCELEKRKKVNRFGGDATIKTEKNKECFIGKGSVKEKEPDRPIKRPPVLILRKNKCVKKGHIIDERTASMALYVASMPSKLLLGKWKIYNFGEKGSGFKSRGEPQDFYKLRDECLENGTLFDDQEFQPTDSSLFFSQRPDRYYEWKRPSEICDNPQFFVEGYSRFDVQQGELGDCWLLAAAANLTLYQRLFFQIVPDDQDFDEKYAGIFHFRFWQYGRWIDVVIDDRLPTYKGQLIFLHSTEENEFWSALLEKAYAKLHGSYEALKGGSTCEAMEDFTGGVTEMYEMDASPPNLFQIMIKAYERASLMGCSIEPDPNVVEAQTPEGLIRGHAYSITRVQYVEIQTPNVTGKIPLLRLRNPWGNESEWNGPWSDGSPEWRFISDSEKEELGLTFDNDGEFWMSYKDFQVHFSRLEICNLNPDSLSEEELREGNKKKWEMSVFEGEWVRGVTAGGCRNFLDSFWHNPQYRVTLTEVDEGDNEGNCTLIIGLMQKNRRQIRNTGADLLTVGFAIYHLPYPDRVPKPLDLNFFKYNASVARSPSFINLREVSCRFKLPPGTYCIVPSTFDPNEEGEFLLRVFSENKNNMEENDEHVGFGELDEKAVHEIPIIPKIITKPAKIISKKAPEVAHAEPTQEEQEETDKVYEVFLKLAGEDKEVDWKELKEILDYSMKEDLTRSGFSKDICRSMIAMMDADRSGKLGYDEFKNLWISLRNWKNVWTLYDTDNSGTFSGFELREAMHSAGYRLNNRVLNALMHRYGNKSAEIQFDDFMMCAIKLKTMMDIFKAKDQSETNAATFSLEEWLENTLYS